MENVELIWKMVLEGLFFFFWNIPKWVFRHIIDPSFSIRLTVESSLVVTQVSWKNTDKKTLGNLYKLYQVRLLNLGWPWLVYHLEKCSFQKKILLKHNRIQIHQVIVENT